MRKIHRRPCPLYLELDDIFVRINCVLLCQNAGLFRHLNNRDQAILAELGLPDVQHAARKADIGTIEAKRLTRSQTCARQQSDEHR
jgi:hypothetical protein